MGNLIHKNPSILKRNSFRRGTSFGGEMSVFGEDPFEVLRKRFKEQAREDQGFIKIIDLLHEFSISRSEMSDFISNFMDAMELGLSSPSKVGDLKMIPTYVTKVPTGKETGEYLALDLGGTNFRVLLLNLKGDPSQIEVKSSAYNIPETAMKGTGAILFEFIADKILTFIEHHEIDKDKEYNLGFTFSFPCDQKNLKKGLLVRWTKGFDCSDVVGKDVVALLQTAINKKSLKIKVVALVNDTVGTLMACAYTHPNCAVGLIVGTGTNACYIEEVANIHNVNNIKTKSPSMIINIEWGAYGDLDREYNIDRFITRFDDEIDEASVNPGMQRFEKLISGLYMGEVVRKIILFLIEKNLLFKQSQKHSESLQINMSALNSPNSFYTRYVSDIERDRGKKFTKTKGILQSLGIPKPELYDCAIIHCVCKIVSIRAAKLLACGIAAILTKIDLKDLTIGVDGSLYRYHPTFMRNVEYHLNLILKSDVQYRMSLATDGSGIGAALAAAAAESA